jgi:diguanylate cyclase
MRAFILHFLLWALTAALGAIGGWWFHERRARRWDLLFAYEKQLAQQTVTLLDRLLLDVRTGITEHSANLEKTSAAIGAIDPAAPDRSERAEAACHALTQTNCRLVDRLSIAEERLANQAAQIDSWLKTTATRPRGDDTLTARSTPLQRLREISADLAGEVGQHHHDVERVARQIDVEASADGAQVITAITEIMEATARMQQRIAAAEEKLQEQAQKLEMQAAIARTDGLTELGNRRAFDEELSRRRAESLRDGLPLSVVLIDVDHFKRLNDRHGHQAGDTVLRGLAETLRVIVREADVVTRYGGEEFALLLPHTPLDLAIRVAERAREGVASARYAFAKVEHHVTVSTGIAEITASEQADDIVRRADEALYRAKQAGRNRSYYHDGRMSRPVRPADAIHDSAGEGLCREPRGGTSPAGPISYHPRTPSGPALSNRTIFFADVSRRLAERKRGGSIFAVVLARIDNRSQLVEQFGGEVAEVICSTMARFLEALAREMDDRCLYDADTFGVLLPGTDHQTAVEIAERLRRGIDACRVRYGTADIHFTSTVAAADATAGDTATDILRAAEEALQASVPSRS